MPTRKLRTEDIWEIEDSKIFLARSHPALFLVEGDALSLALPYISEQVLSLTQKIALDQVISLPSATNPIVLKDDIQTYYPLVQLGGFKDTVPSFTDLPVTGNNVGDMRAVFDEGNVYRWSEDLEWIEFLRFGAMKHTLLSQFNEDEDYQHLTSVEKTTLVTQIHMHENKDILDAIESLGSGKVITNSERDKLPTSDEKDAMIGTAYEPSVLNRFVTSQDPRLNTLKNPYVTYGPEGTVATFQKEEIQYLLAALAYVATAEVRAVEVLPGTYRLNFFGDERPLIWDSEGTTSVTVTWDQDNQQIVPASLPYREVQNNALLLECMSLRNSVFRFQCFQPALQLSGPGESQATVRGLVFELQSTGTSGIEIGRANTLIDECTFRAGPGSILAHGLRGITVNAPNCVIRRCIFEGVLAEGLVVNAERTRIEECQFNLSDASSTALDLLANADFTIVNNCTFYQGTVQVRDQALSNLFTNCTHYLQSPFVDSGVATRWLSNRAGRFQQAYIGRTRTLGGPNSFADFVGSDEQPFLQALADPYTKEIVVLSGTSFAFTETVEIPEGIVVRAGDLGNNKPEIVGPSGSPAFLMHSRSALIGLSITGANSSLVRLVANASRVDLKNCRFNPLTVGFFGIAADDGSLELRVENCQFSGSKGLLLLRPEKCYIHANHFATVAQDLAATAGLWVHISRNIFFCTNALALNCQDSVVEQNYFVGAIPTKVNTTQTVWQANWPHPKSNNEDGVDHLKLSLDAALSPIPGTGASRTLASGIRVLAYEETGHGTAVTMPQKLTSKIDRARPFEVHIYWSSNTVFSGTVLWEVTVTFRDKVGQDFGTSATKTVSSARTKLLFNREEKVIVPFTLSDYGYLAGVDVTHYSVIIRRLADNPLDTLAGTALLTEAQIILPRD